MHDSSSMKILLVEDNELEVFMFRRMLKKLSLDLPITHARNGEEALAILRPADDKPSLTPPFIMIVDINMPRMSGFDLLDELGDDEILSQVPIYMTSTSTLHRDRERALTYRIRAYIVKPLTQSMLLEMINGDTDGQYGEI